MFWQKNISANCTFIHIEICAHQHTFFIISTILQYKSLLTCYRSLIMHLIYFACWKSTWRKNYLKRDLDKHIILNEFIPVAKDTIFRMWYKFTVIIFFYLSIFKLEIDLNNNRFVYFTIYISFDFHWITLNF